MGDIQLQEYIALRNEILKRLEFQNQLKSLALLSAAGVTTVGLSGDATILLAFPILIMFLALDWAENNYGVLVLGDYLRHVEESQGYRGWESRGALHTPTVGLWRRFFTNESHRARALFAGIQVLALALGLGSGDALTGSDIVVAGVSTLAIGATAYLQQSRLLGGARRRNWRDEEAGD